MDSRADFPPTAPALETPGGDIAELQAAIVIYHRMTGTNATDKSVNQIFKAFMTSKYITTSRPFYYHTAESGDEGLMSLIGQPASPIPDSISPDDTTLFIFHSYQECVCPGR